MQRRITLTLMMTLGALAAASFVAPAPLWAAEPATPPGAAAMPVSAVKLAAPPPAFAGDFFPCTNCHAGMTPDPRRRELRDEHAAISLRHAAGQLWCLDCHQAQNRDSLRLATGESLPFTESYRLCGQCHGEKLRDWQSGLHGKRTGDWNGAKQYLLCTGCHNPHEPRFKA